MSLVRTDNLYASLLRCITTLYECAKIITSYQENKKLRYQIEPVIDDKMFLMQTSYDRLQRSNNFTFSFV